MRDFSVVESFIDRLISDAKILAMHDMVYASERTAENLQRVGLHEERVANDKSMLIKAIVIYSEGSKK